MTSLFVIVTILMGRWGAQTVAAHQIALNYGSMMFMVPLGMSVALTTHIGQALGAREFHKMEVISISGMFMAMCFMFLSANIIILFDQEIPHLYTNEPELIQAATTFILWAAIFQPVDGMQVIFQGALRGMQDTLIPFINCLVSYVFVGFPVGYYVCWEMEVGPEGLWTGMTSGLFCSCILNGARLYFRLRPYRIKTSKDVEMMP